MSQSGLARGLERGYGARMFDAFFQPGSRASFRECYELITGDRRITGRIENCNQTRLAEALDSSTWSSALGDAVHRRMVAEYQRPGGRYSEWRKLASVARNITDFRTQRRVRWGGYGDLPAVNEGAAYQAMTSPADEEVAYDLTKRGGTETITLEMVKNDDIQAIRKIPERLAQTAHRTLSRFVLNFLKDNPVIYDSVTLFHATHGNLASAALSAASLEAGRAAMRKQTEPGSSDRLGLEPKYLWVSIDGEEAAVNLFRRGANQDRTFTQQQPLEVVPVWCWTDADDWCLSADPASCPTIEIGFLDGQEEPDLFAQDLPNVGSLFANDQMTFKIRHVYGGAAIDYRGLYKSVV